ncbi:MAG TPA: ABC transporter substrate-binding protein [Candidatus Limiplasma sp.]|nr:ABC transporter substrate-binding protein [Candidatus Limiplasma sp.]
MRKVIALLLTLLMLSAAIPVLAEEPVTVKMNTCIVFSDLHDLQMIEDKLDSMLAEKGYNFKVEIVPFDYGNYGKLVSLALADGSIDLFNMFGAVPLSVAADNESIAKLDDLLAKYGPDTLKLIQPYIDTVTVDGSIYGTPAIKSIGKRNNFLYNADMAEAAGFVPENVHDYDSLTTELLKVKAKYPDMAMVSSGYGGMWFWPNMDTLGNDNYYACIVLDDNAQPKIVNYYETDLYKKDLERAKVWGDNNFFVKDAINGQNAPMALFGQHLTFGCFTDNVSPEYVLESSAANYDFKIGCVTAESEPWATTTTTAGFTWCIAELSQHKEEAAQLLNLLYTDSDVANLIINGIEGVHYKVLDDGSIDYPSADVTASNVGWASPSGFMPNSWIAYPRTPITPASIDRYRADNESCRKSPAFGFSFNSVDVMDQISACNNVCSKYLAPLMLGMGDDQMLADFQADLKKAGVDDIIAEKQKQLDAWLAAKQ